MFQPSAFEKKALAYFPSAPPIPMSPMSELEFDKQSCTPAFSRNRNGLTSQGGATTTLSEKPSIHKLDAIFGLKMPMEIYTLPTRASSFVFSSTPLHHLRLARSSANDQ